MEQIFISSLARGEMADVREATRRAVDALDMRPVMFETGAASDRDSRRALLDRVVTSDALVLLLGAEYGEPGERGLSPTEEEFNEARDRGVPVLAFVQNTTREPVQDAFISRVRGTWERGLLSSTFNDATDVGFAVTKALNAWRRQRDGGDTTAAAATRAVDLARGDERRGSIAGGSKLRVVAVPAVSRPLLDALKLRDSSLLEDLAGAARASRLAPQSVGIDAEIGQDVVRMALSGTADFGQLVLRIGFDGAVVGEGAVAGDGLAFAGSVVMADRAREVMARTMAFTEAVWQRIDARDEVRDVLVTCAVPEAEHKVYAVEPVGSSMSMPMSMPNVLVAPDPPLQARRADLPEVVERLQAELHRAFELQGAVHPKADARRAGSW